MGSICEGAASALGPSLQEFGAARSLRVLLQSCESRTENLGERLICQPSIDRPLHSRVVLDEYNDQARIRTKKVLVRGIPLID